MYIALKVVTTAFSVSQQLFWFIWRSGNVNAKYKWVALLSVAIYWKTNFAWLAFAEREMCRT